MAYETVFDQGFLGKLAPVETANRKKSVSNPSSEFRSLIERMTQAICRGDGAVAFERAVHATGAEGMPALIELRIDPQAITPNTTLDALREQALKRA